MAGHTNQICEYKLIAHDRLANDYGNLKIEHRAGIDEGGRRPRVRVPSLPPFKDRYFRFADQQGRMRRLATRPGSTVALVANESINQHFKSHAENFCRW